jgi:hypothetical protein
MRWALAFLFATACSSSVESTADSQSSVSYAGAEQDWSLFPNGQCLVAVQMFYPAKFGVGVPIARSAWTENCAPQGACHIWLDDIPSASDWERIPNDGSEQPSPYDLIVFPPTQSNPWGHIASVDHVDAWGNIYVMDSNFNYDNKRAFAPHTVSRAAYGWYHLRQLPKSEGQSPGDWCPNNALYCGGDIISGDPDTLYRCTNHHLSVEQTCSYGCKWMPSGYNDYCNPPPSLGWCPNNGLYCGGDYISGDPDTLYRCTNHQLSVEEVCAYGCKVNPDGINDQCW